MTRWVRSGSGLRCRATECPARPRELGKPRSLRSSPSAGDAAGALVRVAPGNDHASKITISLAGRIVFRRGRPLPAIATTQYLARQLPAAKPGTFNLSAIEPVAPQANAIAGMPDATLIHGRRAVGVAPAVRCARRRRSAPKLAERAQQLSCDSTRVSFQMLLAPLRAGMQQQGLWSAAPWLAAVAGDPAQRAFVTKAASKGRPTAAGSSISAQQPRIVALPAKRRAQGPAAPARSRPAAQVQRPGLRRSS